MELLLSEKASDPENAASELVSFVGFLLFSSYLRMKYSSGIRQTVTI